MRTLKVAFLSSLALEILASVGTALVALFLGLRLLDGTVDLGIALAVLVLAPEVYLPLRRAGAEFHASAEGRAAAARILDILDEPRPMPGADAMPRSPDADADAGTIRRPSPARRGDQHAAARRRHRPLPGPGAAGARRGRSRPWSPGSTSPWSASRGRASPPSCRCCSASSSPSGARARRRRRLADCLAARVAPQGRAGSPSARTWCGAPSATTSASAIPAPTDAAVTRALERSGLDGLVGTAGATAWTPRWARAG